MERIAQGFGASNEAQKQLARTVKPMTAAQKQQVKDTERLEQVYRDQLSVLETFEKIITSVFGKITTAFSEALGIDSSTSGVRAMLKTLEGDLEKIFQFEKTKCNV